MLSRFSVSMQLYELSNTNSNYETQIQFLVTHISAHKIAPSCPVWFYETGGSECIVRAI